MVRVGNHLFRNDFANPDYEVGYYWADETGTLFGPYASLDAASDALDSYVESLNQ